MEMLNVPGIWQSLFLGEIKRRAFWSKTSRILNPPVFPSSNSFWHQASSMFVKVTKLEKFYLFFCQSLTFFMKPKQRKLKENCKDIDEVSIKWFSYYENRGRNCKFGRENEIKEWNRKIIKNRKLFQKKHLLYHI